MISLLVLSTIWNKFSDSIKLFEINSLKKIDVSIEFSDRSSRSRLFFKIGVFKNFAILTGERLCWSLFLLIKVAGQKVWKFIKKWLQHSSFPMNIAKFLRALFLKRTPPVTASVSNKISWLFGINSLDWILFCSLIISGGKEINWFTQIRLIRNSCLQMFFKTWVL